MKIAFSRFFEGGAYPSVTAERPCLFGEARVDGGGFLRLLETHLGLTGRYPPSAVRAAALVPLLEKQKGFWSASVQEAPLQSATRLLAWREELAMQGWTGQGASPRLKELAGVTTEFSRSFPGLSDRLRAVLEALADHPVPIREVDLFDRREALPLLWRRLFDALEAEGVAISQGRYPKVVRRGDLQACLERPFAPKGDGTLHLLRPAGPMEAAEQIAAWVAALGEDLDGTVIIGADATLDEALHRFHLPTLGVAGEPSDNSLLQILPLLVECAWQPPDPAKVLELLSLPVAPVPRFLASPLADCLSTWPAVGSDIWNSTLAGRLDTLTDRDDRERLQDRLEAIFTSKVQRGSDYPATELHTRLLLLESWAHGRSRGTADPAPKDGEVGGAPPPRGGHGGSAAAAPTDWQALFQQLENFRRLIEVSGKKGFPEHHLRRLLEQASEDFPVAARRPACAGLTSVGHPGALIGPARRTIWWNFTTAAVAFPRVFPASPKEREFLENVGVELPEAGDVLEAEAGAWRLPFTQTQDTLILVAPRTGSAGGEAFPHPFWDEILANVPKKQALACLTVPGIMSRHPLKTVRKKRQALPEKRLDWSLPKNATLPERTESPTSIDTLIRCPFRYVVQYVGRTWAGHTAALPADEILLGELVHHLVAVFLGSGKRTRKKEDWEALARSLFDEQAPRLAAPFFLPGGEIWRTKARQALAVALTGIGALRQELEGFDTLHLEEEITGKAFGGAFAGIPDVALDQPPAIIDLKWGGQTSRAQSLRGGTATQLAAYAFLLKQARRLKEFPPAAYLILQTGRVLTNVPDAFPGAICLEGPPLDATWKGLESAVAERRTAIGDRVVQALGTPTAPLPSGSPGWAPAEASVSGGPPPPTADVLDETGTVRLHPRCDWCAFGRLCGRAFGG